MSWIANIERQLTEHDAIVRVTVIRADGSTPRETGAAMLVGVDHIANTIGGGALELAAIDHARTFLARLSPPNPISARWQRDVLDLALGPSLGQCCGGHAKLLFEAFTVGDRPRAAVNCKSSPTAKSTESDRSPSRARCARCWRARARARRF